jgi:hypothetical protein
MPKLISSLFRCLLLATAACSGTDETLDLATLDAETASETANTEPTDAEPAAKLGSLAAAYKETSGCYGQYRYATTRLDTRIDLDAEWYGWHPIGNRWLLNRQGDAPSNALARERGRRAARDAIAVCGKAHYAKRWDREIPTECKDRVYDYPFNDIKTVLEVDVCDQIGLRATDAEHAVHTFNDVTLIVESDGKEGCTDHHFANDRTYYYPSIDYLTSTYDVYCR